MNNNIIVTDDGPWPVSSRDENSARLGPGQRTYSGTNILDFATLVRILYHWRWLVLGALGLGFAGAVLVTLVTKPTYRASVILEADPPTVDVSEEQSRERQDTTVNSFDFVATQVGLLSSRTVAERTVQQLNLANNPDFASQGIDASSRLREAILVVQKGLSAVPPKDGTLIKLTYDSRTPQVAALVANGIADSFINSALQRRFEASS